MGAESATQWCCVAVATGSDSAYAVHKMMQLTEKVRPCDAVRRRRAGAGGVLTIPAQTLGRNTARRLSPAAARAVASSSPRQLRHRVPPTRAIELSPERSSVSSVGSTRKSASPAGDVSHKPGGWLPLLSARPAVPLATLKRAATSFAAW